MKISIRTLTKLIFCIFISVSLLNISGCGCESVFSEDGSKEDSIKIVTTIFPEYDFSKELSKGLSNFDISLLSKNGVDIHSYQPTVDDIIKITSADIFIYVGGESDAWVDDVIKQNRNDNLIVINLLDLLKDNVKTEEIVEGMEEEEGEEENPFDEHVWLSLKNADLICNEIKNVLVITDPDHQQIFEKNYSDYSKKLNELDQKYNNEIKNSSMDTVIFADRFPFRYMFDDYNLNYYAAFPGCSAESEASFETVIFLADKVDELNISSIVVLENSDGIIADTVINNSSSSGIKILNMNSLQSVTEKDISEGINYLQVMENNLNTVITALNP